MNRMAIALAIVYCALSSAPCAVAGLFLSFDQPSYTIAGPGAAVDVDVLVSQAAGGPQVAAGNELLTAGVVLGYSSPSGIARVQVAADVLGGPAWSSSAASASAGNASLATTSLPGIADLSQPLLIGTFHLTGLSLGLTTISVMNLTPGPSFVTTQGDVLDPTNTATALVQVVPEPSGFTLLTAFALSLGLVARRRAASKSIG